MKISHGILLFMIFVFIFSGCVTTINDAIQNGDLNAVKSIISSDRNKINSRGVYGNSPLHDAAERGELDIVKYLVSQGANVNAKNNCGEIPLHSAAESNYIEMAKYLVSKGAYINTRNKYGTTPLHGAAGHLDIVKYLVSQGADINTRDSDDETPLHDAAKNGNLETIKYFVSQGADVNARDRKGKTPLYQILASRADIEMVKYLVSQGADVNIEDNGGNTPLHTAVSGAGISGVDIEVVKYLISQEADVNARDNYGETPLHNAASRGDIDIVKYLVSQGADVNARDNAGKTALNLAAYVKVANFLSSQMQLTKQKQAEVIASSEAPKKQLSYDTTPPEIIISSHDISRGINIVRKQKKVTISGRAIDKSGIVEVIVDNKEANVDRYGNFYADIYVGIGENQIVVSAMDRYENRATKKFTIIREGLEASPKDKIAGNYYALIIGNNNYKYIRKLETAKKDAQDVMDVLKQRYGFKTKLLLDAKRNDIVSAINDYRKTLKENDNFLIYYAGHGEFDRAAGKAYWLPVDARSDDDTNWIIVDTITSNIKRMSSKHILIVADSCYSGTFTRRAITDLVSDQERDRYLQKMQTKASRTLLASGGNEPVSDIGGKEHSVFADALILALKDMGEKTFSAEELFYQHIKERVAGKADQTPEYNVIRNSGHEGGDFVFKPIY